MHSDISTFSEGERYRTSNDTEVEEKEEIDPLRALGFVAPGERPDKTSSIADLLIYGLGTGHDPVLAIVRDVAIELEGFGQLFEGALGLSFGGLGRRLRVALSLSERIKDVIETGTEENEAEASSTV